MVPKPEWYGSCKVCGWPVLCCCCNDGTWGDGSWDWWAYCTNKTCENHDGEGVFQDIPEWIMEDPDA
jgi:hypothetical protein